ncbi:MAG: IS200/IS605 family transposase [Nitrospirota bacterium]|nr:IS200/IS605 family transposase [Nitrospirota bacterium]
MSREDREESEADRAEFGILRCMNLKRTGGAVYDLKYHVVWVPKYRRIVLGERVARRLKRIFQEIAERYGFEIDTQEVLLDDHVHIFLSAPPRYSPAQVVQRLKSISAQMVFQEFPEVKQQLWSGELWNDGYFVRSVGDNVTAEVIRRDIKHQHDPKQLELNF